MARYIAALAKGERFYDGMVKSVLCPSGNEGVSALVLTDADGEEIGEFVLCDAAGSPTTAFPGAWAEGMYIQVRLDELNHRAQVLNCAGAGGGFPTHKTPFTGVLDDTGIPDGVYTLSGFSDATHGISGMYGTFIQCPGESRAQILLISTNEDDIASLWFRRWYEEGERWAGFVMAKTTGSTIISSSDIQAGSGLKPGYEYHVYE